MVLAWQSSVLLGAGEPDSQTDAGAFSVPRIVQCEDVFQRCRLGGPCQAFPMSDELEVSVMDLLVERVAGLDVAKDEVVAAVRTPDGGGGRRQVIRTFLTFTSGLEALAAWLAEERVSEVVMEATGQYWKPIWYLLEDADFELKLVNARHVKMVPGHKTDVADAAWLAELLEHGLLRGSFVPPPEIRELRDLTRYRKRLIQDHTRECQRGPKDPRGRRDQARLGRLGRAGGVGSGHAAGAAGRRTQPRGPRRAGTTTVAEEDP